jgi:hypothetical protein
MISSLPQKLHSFFVVVLLLFVLHPVAELSTTCQGFTIPAATASMKRCFSDGLQYLQPQPPVNIMILYSGSSSNDDGTNNNIEDDDDDSESCDVDEFHKKLQTRHDEIQIEKTRTALEEQHTQSFLKRKPKKLPYEQARKWVQANLGADTREEYEDLVANGNLRTPYIPKQPEQYYKSTNEWVSWNHFLTGIFDDESPSEIKPSTGIWD